VALEQLPFLCLRGSGSGEGQRLGDTQDEGATLRRIIDRMRCPVPTSRKEREKWGTQFVFSAIVSAKKHRPRRSRPPARLPKLVDRDPLPCYLADSVSDDVSVGVILVDR